MSVWWASLTGLERLFAYVAFPATLLMILQTLMLLFGLGHDGAGGEGLEAEMDLDAGAGGDVDFDLDIIPNGEAPDGPFAGLKLITLRGIVAFFAVAGWGGLWLLRMGMYPLFAAFLAIAMGFWAMLLMALFLKVTLKLQSDGTMDYHNALGKAGSVYLTIPAGRSGTGKVNLLLQDQWVELDAVTDEEERLLTGTEVVVVALSGGSTLVVCRK